MKPISVLTAFQGVLWIKRVPLIIVLLTTMVTSGSASARAVVINIEISGELGATAGVYNYNISPDATRVVFTADLEFNGMSEMYSVPTHGGPRVKLSGDQMINGGNVLTDYKIAPNSQRVVFRADKRVEGMDELWSVPITGGAPVQLNQELASYQDVNQFIISPDSQYVVYSVATLDGRPENIYIVPIEGGYQAKLNGDVGTRGTAVDAVISADSKWVVYRMQANLDGVYDLYSVPIYGSFPESDRIRLNGIPVVNAAGVNTFKITPNGARVVYLARQDQINNRELYSVPIRGPAGSETKLNPDYLSFQDILSYRITPDSSKVVYSADQDTEGRTELYSVPTAGGTLPTRLTDMITFTNVYGFVYDFEITPNSLGVVFRVNPIWNFDLYVVTLDGTIWRKLNPPLEGDQNVGTFSITPDNWGVVYRSDIGGTYQLYSRDMLAKHDPWQLTNVTGGEGVGGFKITPNSQHVVYWPIAGGDLFSVPIRSINQAGTLKWNVPFHLPESNVYYFHLLPDSNSLVYMADTEIEGQCRIFFAFYGYPLYLPNISR